MNRRRVQRPHASVLLAIGMVLLAANLRPAAAAVGPLLGRIRADTGLSATGAGLLTTLPVLCFGALAPLSPRLARRIGERATVVVALALLLFGLLVRLVPGLGFLFFGTAVAGTAIAIANVLLPVLVRGNFPERVGLLTGMYSTTLIGFEVKRDMPGLTGPATDRLYRRGADWLAGRELGDPLKTVD